MPNIYTEDELVEQPAIELFSELGWETISAKSEVLGDGGLLGGRRRVMSYLKVD